MKYFKKNDFTEDKCAIIVFIKVSYIVLSVKSTPLIARFNGFHGYKLENLYCLQGYNNIHLFCYSILSNL